MKKVILFSLALALNSCASSLYIPIKGTDSASLNTLSKGRVSYVENCSGCHSLYSPYKYDNIAWQSILIDMQKEAAGEITDEERDLIYQYLVNAPVIVKN